jgi:GAF domain-containing protein
MDHLLTIGGLETIAMIVFLAVGIALRTWLVRAERNGTLDRSRWVFRRSAVADTTGVWASPHQRSAAERNQPEEELLPLPFRDQVPPDSPPADRAL